MKYLEIYIEMSTHVSLFGNVGEMAVSIEIHYYHYTVIRIS